MGFVVSEPAATDSGDMQDGIHSGVSGNGRQQHALQQAVGIIPFGVSGSFTEAVNSAFGIVLSDPAFPCVDIREPVPRILGFIEVIENAFNNVKV